MKFDISKVMNKKFYDEVFYVGFRESFNFKKPSRKYRLTTNLVIKAMIIITIFVVLFAIAYFAFGSSIYIEAITSLLGLFMAGVILLFLMNRTIKKFISSQVKETLVIDNTGIESIQENKQTVKINWETVKYIVINKYSICVIPKNPISSIMISFDICYKTKFLKAIKEYDKLDLVVDNSSFYQK